MIVLNDAERRSVRFIAAERARVNRSLGIVRPLESGQDDEEVQRNAVGGEFAFCKMANLYPTVTAVTEPPYPPADAIGRRGELIDVKTSRRQSPEFVYVHRDRLRSPVEVYAFMSGTFPRYYFVGWCRSEEVFRPENLVDVGNGPCYRVPVSKLKKPKGENP